MAIDDKTVDSAQSRGISGNTVKDGSGTERRILVDDDGHLQLDVLSAPTITETNSAAIKAALEIMDDWDESNKAAVVLYGFDDPTYRRLKVNASGELSVYTP